MYQPEPECQLERIKLDGPNCAKPAPELIMTVAIARRVAGFCCNAKPNLCRQYFSTVSTESKDIVPVDLNYTLQVPPDGNKTERPLVILHGLL